MSFKIKLYDIRNVKINISLLRPKYWGFGRSEIGIDGHIQMLYIGFISIVWMISEYGDPDYVLRERLNYEMEE